MVERAIAVLGAVLCMAGAAAHANEALKNWFSDPFFQVRSAQAGCPEPLGPRMTEADMRKDAHARVERGTRCWLAGQCTKANAYHYDAAIAEAVRERFRAPRVLPNATLWVTVQRRFVFVEGCAGERDAAGRIARLLRDVPDVERVIVDVARDPRGPLPYRALRARGAHAGEADGG